MQIYRIHSRINIWTGKLIINLNHFKSMLATIHTMFVNEKNYQNIFILSILTMNTREMHFNRSNLTKTSSFPWPLKIPHCGGGFTPSPRFLIVQDSWHFEQFFVFISKKCYVLLGLHSTFFSLKKTIVKNLQDKRLSIE